MASELTPGAIGRSLDKVRLHAEAQSPKALVALAQQVERQAKENAKSGSHRKGEPHVPGTGPGPNVVTGSLRRAITHTQPRKDSVGWHVRVGLAAGAAPGRKHLETGLRNGATYPFLLPAARAVKGRAAGLIVPMYKSWK